MSAEKIQFIFLFLLIIVTIIFFIFKNIIKNLFFIQLSKKSLFDEENKEVALKKIKKIYSNDWLYKKSSLIIKLAKQLDINLITLLDMQNIWLDKLIKNKKEKDLLRILDFTDKKTLFYIFKLTLDNKRLLFLFKDWINRQNSPFIINEIAHLCNGDEFDGEVALHCYKDKVEEIRELMGSSDWQERYFACKIVIYDNNHKSVNAMWEAFSDQDVRIRITIIKEFKPEDKERLIKKLISLIKKDPIHQARLLAWERLHKELDVPISIDNLSPETDEELIHILQLLRENNIEDEKFAFKYALEDNLEIRFFAARFLDQNKSYQRLAENVSLGDTEGFNRANLFLKKAAEVNVTSFFSVIETTTNPATLLLCAKLLTDTGSVKLIPVLAEKSFEFFCKDSSLIELYEETLSCISKRGDDVSLQILNEELKKQKTSEENFSLICSYLPSRASHILLDTLFDIFVNNSFTSTEPIRKALLKMQKEIVMEKSISILLSDKKEISQKVKKDILKLLSEIKSDYCLQIILENLHLLPIEEAKEYAKILSCYEQNLFKSKVKNLLYTVDTKVRATLISALPDSFSQEFLPDIRSFLMDRDPEIRIASIWTIMKYNDYESYQNALALIHDPIEKVRIESAKALCSNSDESILLELKKIFNDKNEINPVKEAIIDGLANSVELKSIEILTELLEKENDDSLIKKIEFALSKKQQNKELEHTVKIFKKATSRLKERMIASFKLMEEKSEEKLVPLLEIATTHDAVVEILEESGFVESKTRKLSHSNVNIRREAVDLLYKIGSKKSYRALVLAARDPDKEIRIKVIKAIESLSNKEYSDILESMKEDPDLRVRKYTLWALERIEAKTT